MHALEPSPLEAALLNEFHALYRAKGFPDPRNITVVGRENTGAGRYVRLHSTEASVSENGVFDLAGKFISMQGLPNGLMAVVHVSGGRPTQIEIAVYGEYEWNGEERAWLIS